MKILFALCLLLLNSLALHAEKPNIIVIMADDMGYADAGFTGFKDILTPNLDKLAALLSGRYQHRSGFETNPAYSFPNGIEITSPAFLSSSVVRFGT